MVAALVAVLVAVALAPGLVNPRQQAANGPFDFRGLGGALLAANQVGLAVTTLAVVVGAASLVVRFRHAHAVERQQLRWVALASMPLAIVAAVLRYRLYDLDRIISRTLAYGLLTLLLAGGYAVVALGLGQLLGQDSSLAVAAATLAVAALFQPARRRVQAVVDRRFNRRRHDAARIIEGFGTRLRDQVELDTLTTDML